jgi:hypothetical protein
MSDTPMRCKVVNFRLKFATTMLDYLNNHPHVLNEWELDFIMNMNRIHYAGKLASISANQFNTLHDIYDKYQSCPGSGKKISLAKFPTERTI